MATLTSVTDQYVDETGIPQGAATVTFTLLDSTGIQVTEAFSQEEQVAPVATVHTDPQGNWTRKFFPNSTITPANTHYQMVVGAETVNFVVPVDGATPVVHFLADLVI